MSLFSKLRQILGLKPIYVLHKIPEKLTVNYDDCEAENDDEFNNNLFNDNDFDDFNDDELDPFFTVIMKLNIEREDEHELDWDENEEDYYLKDLEENDLLGDHLYNLENDNLIAIYQENTE
ncbi:hypothetical protein [Lyngbya sp. PCC 8106]|uniref:hypothetical protein n=1 Tax=Lyngbya sp. (strain PCC 8106) TaxID=313612 RepID=UPI0000EAB647|nr:hypothetical protein [Lyngbya sp. PCC 8106]EAW35974.1 hypothetical protein L8106_22301 [Lyngbya sp. PCC 8106]